MLLFKKCSVFFKRSMQLRCKSVTTLCLRYKCQLSTKTKFYFLSGALESSWKPNQLPHPHCDQSKHSTVNIWVTLDKVSHIVPGTGTLHLPWYIQCIYGALMEIGTAISSLWKLMVEIMLPIKIFCWRIVILLLESAESIFKFILLMFINYLLKRKKRLGI